MFKLTAATTIVIKVIIIFITKFISINFLIDIFFVIQRYSFNCFA